MMEHYEQRAIPYSAGYYQQINTRKILQLTTAMMIHISGQLRNREAVSVRLIIR